MGWAFPTIGWAPIHQPALWARNAAHSCRRVLPPPRRCSVGRFVRTESQSKRRGRRHGLRNRQTFPAHETPQNVTKPSVKAPCDASCGVSRTPGATPHLVGQPRAACLLHPTQTGHSTPSAGLPHSAPSTDPADKGGGRKTGPGSLGPTVRQSSKTSRKTLTAPAPSDPRPGGRCWIRTNVGYADGFTDRSLWPLGQPAVLGVQRRRQ